MEPHCALKATGQLFKNKGCYHHNANDRLGFNVDIYFAITAALMAGTLLRDTGMLSWLWLMMS